MAMRTINGIRYREEDVELLQPVFDKALGSTLQPVANKGRRAATKKARPTPKPESDE